MEEPTKTETEKTAQKRPHEEEPPTAPIITTFKSSPKNSPVPDSPERTPSPRFDDPSQPIPIINDDENKKGNNEAESIEDRDVEDQPPLTNFFDSGTMPLPKIEPSQPTADLGAPPPKLPKQAHYFHNEAEENEYSTDVKPEPIIVHEDSEEEEEELLEPARPNDRYFKKSYIFEKYDFKFRKFKELVNLAVYAHKEKVIEAIHSNRVVVIEGFTGCGKTTQVPQFILDSSVDAGKTCRVVVTQPRRIAAISVAKRVCVERGWELGTVVGYQVGMDTKVDRRETMITYMTTGVLLQKLIRMKSLKDWTHIIIDEVHERDLETDFLLLVIQKILSTDVEGKEKHVKLILMSATLNAEKFSKYFRTRRSEGEELEEAPIIRIPHSMNRHAVDEFFLDTLLTNNDDIDEIYSNIAKDKAAVLPEMYEIAVKTAVHFDEIERRNSINKLDPRAKANAVKDIKLLESRGSVLIFLPGILEIKTLFRLLTDENKSHTETNGGDPDHYKWDLIPLHSSITSEEQTKVFEPGTKGRRKIILSTNIAESSITVPDIIYVIDFCLTKSLTVDSRTNFSSLRMVWASISQCIQRKGRTGRVGPGQVYRLVPKKFFAELDEHSVPEMLKSSLEQVVLRVKTLNMGSPRDILSLAIDPPKLSGIERAIVNLKEVGALTLLTTKAEGELVYDTCDGDLTFMGEVMSSLPISLQCSRLILLGHVFGVMKECVIIAAGLSVKSPFSTPFQKQLESYLQKLDWAEKTYSDCFALLRVYKHWSLKFGDAQLGPATFRNERMWGRGAFVQVSVMREMRALVEELEDRIKSHGITPYPLPNNESTEQEISLTKEQQVMIKIAIAGAFYPNYFHRHRPDMKNYERERSREVNGQDLFCSVYLKGFPSGNIGKIYAKHVQDRLSHGLDIPALKFEGSKVIAIFDNKSEKIGPICKGVYRAAKMRQIKDRPIEFNVLWKEKEPDYLKRQEDKQEEIRSKFLQCPPQIELPGVGIKEVYVLITHKENPSQFWVVYQQHRTLLATMTRIINANLSRQSLRKSELLPGSFCLAPFKVGINEFMFYRAKIVSVNPVGEAKVYYVDFGNSDWVEVSKLQPFSRFHKESEIHLNPCLAVECRLSNLKPAILFGSVWSDEAIKKFTIFTENSQQLRLEVYSVVNGIINGVLFGMTGGRELSLNIFLKKQQFADIAPENFLSETNHRARERFELMENDPAQIEAHNKMQVAEELDLTVVEPPDQKEAKSPAHLKGPWSPLELEFQSLCHSSNSKQVTIDGGSVNSVMLDHEPTAPTSRLLISSSIGIQDKSGRIVARDTTLMPAVPGLLALVSMAFCPKMELRINNRRSRYTGALCGLGMDPLYEASIYQDHDVEIVFDTEMTDEDIDEINRIRFYMNIILRKPGNEDLIPIHNAVIGKMVRLMKKTRKRLDEEVWPVEAYSWNKIDLEYVVPPSPVTFPVEAKDIFLPHSTIILTNNLGPQIQWEYGI